MSVYFALSVHLIVQQRLNIQEMYVMDHFKTFHAK